MHVLIAVLLLAQDTAAAPPQQTALRVFLDCTNVFCDFDYLRTEVGFVNYVRDRAAADVHVLVTGQDAGAGGQAYTLLFVGRERFASAADTLRFVTAPTDTEDQQRAALARVLGLGLARFAAQTPTGTRLRVTYNAPAEQGTAAAVRDPWNFWVFEVGGGGDLSAEEHVRDVSFSGSLEANRVTEAWKIQIETNTHYNENTFEIPVLDSAGNEIGTRTLTSISRSHEMEGLVVRSLGKRWSAGTQAAVTSATFENLRLSARLAPAVEFNVFPYAEATRRALVLRYSIGVRAVAYRDTTIFDKLSERLIDQRLEVSFEVTQPWGRASVDLEASHYLHDAAKHRLELEGSGEFRLYKGLSLNVYGGASRVRDQITLPKAGATPDEVLLRRRELATGYQVYGGMSLSFTFGSIFSTIVNPRFDT